MFAKFIDIDERFAFSFEQVDDSWLEFSDEAHKALFDEIDAARPALKVIGQGPDGLPEVQDPPPPTTVQLAVFARVWRDGILSQTDGIVARQRDEVEAGAATSLAADQYIALQVYRQALRQWPDGSSGFPADTSRPVAPDFLAALLANA